MFCMCCALWSPHLFHETFTSHSLYWNEFNSSTRTSCTMVAVATAAATLDYYLDPLALPFSHNKIKNSHLNRTHERTRSHTWITITFSSSNRSKEYGKRAHERTKKKIEKVIKSIWIPLRIAFFFPVQCHKIIFLIWPLNMESMRKRHK